MGIRGGSGLCRRSLGGLGGLGGLRCCRGKGAVTYEVEVCMKLHIYVGSSYMIFMFCH